MDKAQFVSLVPKMDRTNLPKRVVRNCIDEGYRILRVGYTIEMAVAHARDLLADARTHQISAGEREICRKVGSDESEF